MFGFDKIEKKSNFKFEKTYLKSVVAQIKFIPTNSVVDNKSQLIDLFSGAFKNHNDIKVSSMTFSVDDKNQMPIIKDNVNGVEGIEFLSGDGNRKLIIRIDSLTFVIAGHIYENFDVFSNEVEKYFNDTLNLLKISNLERVAIRKINMIEFGNTEHSIYDVFSGVLNTSLVSNLKFTPCVQNLTSHIVNTQFKNLDGYNLILNYGVMQGGIITPSENSVNNILLDIDLFKDDKQLTNINYLNEMTLINDEIFNVFNWSVTEELISNLKTRS